MSTDLSTPDMRQLTRLSYSSAAFFGLWFMVCSPQPIFNVFIANYLTSSPAALGTLVGLISAAQVCNLLAPVIAPQLRRRKTFWIVTTTVHRLNGFMLAAVSFWVAQGGDRIIAYRIILVGMVISWVLGSTAGPAWWSWMADILPEHIRSSFFGRRAAVVNIVNVTWFLLVTIAIDLAPGEQIFTVFGFVFLIGGIGGVMDVLMHIPMEEPEQERVLLRWTDFIEPLSSVDFRRFLVGLAVALIAINLTGPFLPPYLTGATTIGAPAVWLGIQFVLTQLVVVIVAPSWGLMMDRMGRRAIVVVGLLFPLTWVGYFFMTPTNYTILVPLMAVAAGLISPAFWEGIQQLNLALAPRRNRIAYVSWFWTIFGLAAAFGSWFGGQTQEFLTGPVLATSTWRPLDVVLVATISLLVPAGFLMLRVREPHGRSLGYVMSRIANPGVFRAMVNVNVLATGSRTEHIQRTLRTSEPGAADIATREIIARLDDADPEVRDEAVRALGRLRVAESASLLWSIAEDADRPERVTALRALSRLLQPTEPTETTARIQNILSSPRESSIEMREACVYALGEIGGLPGRGALVQMIDDSNIRIAVAALSALTTGSPDDAPATIVGRLYRLIPGMAVGGFRRQVAVCLARSILQSRELEYTLREGPERRHQYIASEIRALKRRFPQITRDTIQEIVMELVHRDDASQRLSGNAAVLGQLVAQEPEHLTEASALVMAAAFLATRESNSV